MAARRGRPPSFCGTRQRGETVPCIGSSLFMLRGWPISSARTGTRGPRRPPQVILGTRGARGDSAAALSARAPVPQDQSAARSGRNQGPVVPVESRIRGQPGSDEAHCAAAAFTIIFVGWRGGRAAECAGLENQRHREVSEGSNPSPSVRGPSAPCASGLMRFRCPRHDRIDAGTLHAYRCVSLPRVALRSRTSEIMAARDGACPHRPKPGARVANDHAR